MCDMFSDDGQELARSVRDWETEMTSNNKINKIKLKILVDKRFVYNLSVPAIPGLAWNHFGYR